jgi:hypothetical protein
LTHSLQPPGDPTLLIAYKVKTRFPKFAASNSTCTAYSEVVLAANEVPSINDITAGELAPLLPRVAAFDPVVKKAIAAGRLRVCSSGSDLPVIDLTRVSPALAAEAAGADLLVGAAQQRDD